MRLERFAAQRVCRAVHVGPRATEEATLAEIDRAAFAGELVPTHAHLQVCLTDPSRTPLEKLQTVLLRELR